MKIAICVSGHLRTYKDCLKSEHLQDLIDLGDVYVTTWSHGYTNICCNKPDQSLDYLVDIEDVKKSYDTNNVKIYSSEFDTSLFDKMKSNPSLPYAGYMSMHYLIKECTKYAIESDSYDIIIRIRPDLFFLDPIKIIDHDLVFGFNGFF